MSGECFHCGLEVPAGAPWRCTLLGAERAFCCAGCEAVAQTIAGAGLGAYYTARTMPALRPQAADEARVQATEYDAPQAEQQFVACGLDGEREAVLLLEGLRCAACAWLCERTLRAVPGVVRADVNAATGRAVVAWDGRRGSLSRMVEALRVVGYDASPCDPAREDAGRTRAVRRELWRLFVAGFGAMQGMMYAFPAYLDGDGGTLSPDAAQLMRWAGLLMTLPVVLFSCGPFFSGALGDLKRRRIGLDVPIALGIAVGFAASAWAVLAHRGEVYFDSISMLVFLLLGARFIRSAARRRAARGLDPLFRWMPEHALRLAEPGDWESAAQVAAHALLPGDLVLVPAGARIAADGEVVQGASATDESLLSGESRPVPKTEGAGLVAGSVNLEQPLVMRVVRAGAQTRAAAIGRLVDRAAASRPRLVAAADRVAGALTGLVLLTALAAALYWWEQASQQAVWVAVAVLVASCPCALALAAPVVLTRFQSELVRRGAALLRGSAVETLANVSDVVFDKTGTLTEGKPALARVEVLGPLDAKACHALACALQAGSRHPVAHAFRDGGAGIEANERRTVAGQGVEARIAGRLVRMGTYAFCGALCVRPLPGESGAEPGADRAPAMQVMLADADGWLACFHLEDALRPEAAPLVARLKERGRSVHLLSGDRAEVVRALAGRLGIAHARGAASPEDKLEYVARLQREGKRVAMVGDGLNDAPVLARADASIAMAGGADVARLKADVALLSEGLGPVEDAFELAPAAMRLIRRNFAWAAAYNLIVLPLAAAGWIGPWEAALGMAASSMVVVVNSLRPLRPAQQQGRAPHLAPKAGINPTAGITPTAG